MGDMYELCEKLMAMAWPLGSDDAVNGYLFKIIRIHQQPCISTNVFILFDCFVRVFGTHTKAMMKFKIH